jgi:plasmid stabilization system protein ParE
MIEPGLNRHEWESEWQSLEEQLADAPAEALSDVDDLVERMLIERGYSVADPVAREGDDREIVAEFHAAREITRLIEEASDDVSPGDVAAAVNGYRAIFEYLIAERSAP